MITRFPVHVPVVFAMVAAMSVPASSSILDSLLITKHHDTGGMCKTTCIKVHTIALQIYDLYKACLVVGDIAASSTIHCYRHCYQVIVVCKEGLHKRPTTKHMCIGVSRAHHGHKVLNNRLY